MRGPASYLQYVLQLLLWRCSPTKCQEISNVCRSNIRTGTNLRKPGSPFFFSGEMQQTWKKPHQLVSTLRELCAIIPYLCDFTRSLFLLYLCMLTLNFWVWTLVWWWLEGHIYISTRFCSQSLYICAWEFNLAVVTHTQSPCNTGKSNFHASYSWWATQLTLLWHLIQCSEKWW